MPVKIIGREQAVEQLESLYRKDTADFLAVYGRRRIGKTFLIRNFFQARSGIYFEVTGLKDGALKTQLKLFADKISQVFYKNLPIQVPKNWLEAFKLLTQAINTVPTKQKVILFIDELPWFATKRSMFVQALDYYWNTAWSIRKNLKLIVCGSAASWMIENLIHAKGGLHNRLTSVIALNPFDLYETREYLLYRGIKLDERQILEIYMAMGGVPYYLSQIEKGKSAAQNINRLCFEKGGILSTEFTDLFSSLFDDSMAHLELIRLIAQSRSGIAREELIKKANLSTSGGTFKLRLVELEEAGFIARFIPYGHKNKGTYYRIIDEYTLFYLHWIEPMLAQLNLALKSTGYWEGKAQSQKWKIWSGYAFEAICFKHIKQIKQALGINVIATEIGSWRYKTDDPAQKGTQIDLLIDRADNVVNLCEIKYCTRKFIITKKYAEEIRNKIMLYQTHVSATKTIFPTMITVEGIQSNAQSIGLITNEVTLNKLFLYVE